MNEPIKSKHIFKSSDFTSELLAEVEKIKASFFIDPLLEETQLENDFSRGSLFIDGKSFKDIDIKVDAESVDKLKSVRDTYQSSFSQEELKKLNEYYTQAPLYIFAKVLENIGLYEIGKTKNTIKIYKEDKNIFLSIQSLQHRISVKHPDKYVDISEVTDQELNKSLNLEGDVKNSCDASATFKLSSEGFILEKLEIEADPKLLSKIKMQVTKTLINSQFNSQYEVKLLKAIWPMHSSPDQIFKLWHSSRTSIIRKKTHPQSNHENQPKIKPSK